MHLEMYEARRDCRVQTGFTKVRKRENIQMIDGCWCQTSKIRGLRPQFTWAHQNWTMGDFCCDLQMLGRNLAWKHESSFVSMVQTGAGKTQHQSLSWPECPKCPHVLPLNLDLVQSSPPLNLPQLVSELTAATTVKLVGIIFACMKQRGQFSTCSN